MTLRFVLPALSVSAAAVLAAPADVCARTSGETHMRAQDSAEGVGGQRLPCHCPDPQRSAYSSSDVSALRNLQAVFQEKP